MRVARTAVNPLSTRRLAALIALVTAVMTWWTWGSLTPLPIVQDEISYVLQSRIFARGHWAAPSPPVPSSFQQPHVLTTPGVASKYPPGHALLLAPTAAVNMPWLSSLILSAITAIVLFLLLQAEFGTSIGVAGWLIWLSDPIGLRFRPSYFSEVTSGLMWLVVLWALRRWRETSRARWLGIVALALGWCAITRPLSAVALAIPVSVVVTRHTIKERSWRALAIAFAVGTTCVALLPLWNLETTGSVSTSPVSVYRERYLPFDKPGFGLDSTPPSVGLAPVNADVYAEFAQEHVNHTLAKLPRIALQRLHVIAVAEWHGWRIALTVFAIAGLWAATRETWLALATAASLFLCYLSYAHFSGWTIYYVEGLPALAMLMAAGMALTTRWLSTKNPRITGHAARIAVNALLAIGAIVNAREWRTTHIEQARYDNEFRALTRQLPFNGSVVFVRYAPNAHPHPNIVRNSATLLTDRVWVVIDDPARNMDVLRAAKGRVPLLFDERGGTIATYGALQDSLRLQSPPVVQPHSDHR